MTIDGHGHILDFLGKDGHSALHSSSGNITLKNLGLINGHNDITDVGGAIYITGYAQLTLINCNFTNNWTHNYGVAVYNGINKTLKIINCSFSGNTAEVSGGAISSKGEIYLENSIFNYNTASYNGGAIYCNNVNVKNCSFKSNKALYNAMTIENNGGAICALNVANIDNCTFEDNYAGYRGGAVYAFNMYVNNNQDSNSSFNSFFINNEVGRAGGALYSMHYLPVKKCSIQK